MSNEQMSEFPALNWTLHAVRTLPNAHAQNAANLTDLTSPFYEGSATLKAVRMKDNKKKNMQAGPNII